ncbi:MAG TPA: amino acid permease, partial [Bacillales bacterium]|nr:amino acid permease [Bacillales bacterium]
MKNHETIKHMVNHKKIEQMSRGKGDAITWRQLTLIGMGSVIGAGFFLGTGLSISLTGPSVLIGYLIAGVAAFLAFAALSEMTVNDPQKGSFRVYARKAFGHGGGFVSGWMYWTAGVLIMSSEVTALSTFTRYWFHNIPLWIFASIYSALGLGINLLGVNNFGKIES